MPLSHWMKIKLRQHYHETICKNANKYDKLLQEKYTMSTSVLQQWA